MFRKKNKAPAVQQRGATNQNQSATPSAVTAAAQVFLKQQASNASLSSAAAAAALRSHTTSPTPVGNIQTKRMVRRNSNSSIGSGTGSLRQPFSSNMQRSPSNGSMTGRTFRSPSPAQVPPVPSLPAGAPPIPDKSHRRNQSQEAPIPRVTSPTPQNGARAVSVDRGAEVAAKRANRPAITLPNVSEQNERQEVSPTTGRFVKNFSRPMSPSQMSPTSASATDAARIQRDMRRTAEQPVHKNTNKITTPAQGTHLANATSPTSPRTTIPSNAPNAALLASTKAQARATPSQRPMTPTEQQALVAQRKAAAMLARPRSAEPGYYPPVVRSKAAPPVPKIPAAAQQGQTSPVTPKATAAVNSAAKNQTQSAAVTTPEPRTRVVSMPVAPSINLATPQAQVQRTSSVSPSRSAHFSEKPVLDAVRHNPPPRSLSPAKSALKGSSPRPSSPADSRQGGSEFGDDPSQASDEGTGLSSRKKKSVRVSFDEHATPIGTAATPTTPNTTLMSPQYKSSPPGAFNADSDEEDSMAPMPTLPSFGSVRGRKDPKGEPTSALATNVESSAESTTPNVEQTSAAPAIAILPATPNPDEVDRQLAESPTNNRTSLEDVLSAENVKHVAQSSPKAEDEPLHTVNDLVNDPDPASSDYGSEEFSDKEDPEVYTDAEEHTANGDAGFASLDAILESPSSEVPPPVATSSLDRDISAAAPGSAVTTNEAVAADHDGDWDTVKAYWSSLSKDQQRDMELRAIPIDQSGGESSVPEPSSIDVWANEQSAVASGSQLATEPIVETTNRGQTATSPVQTKPATGKKETLPSSLRKSEQPGVNTMPTSMRGENKSRPAKNAASGIAAGSAAVGASGSAGRNQQITKPVHRRVASDDSTASASSFRKARPTSAAASDGRYSMRRSMRGGPSPEPSQDVRPTSPATVTMRSSMRGAPSPPTAQQPSGGRYTMRASARNSVDSTTSNSRAEPRAPKESSGFFGMGKGNKKKSKPSSKPAAKSVKRFASRFADSSDEDDDRPMFRSRFADSDDDSDDDYRASRRSAKLTPVRGIPRKAGQTEGDSTDLSDSDEDITRSTNPTTVTNGTPQKSSAAADDATLAALTGGSGDVGEDTQKYANLPDSLTQDKKKRGIFGFGRKKNSVDNTERQGNAEVEGVASRPTSRMSKTLRREDDDGLPQIPRPAFWRRMSGSYASSVKTESRQEEVEHPFPPPPIPDQYKTTYTADRPNTSDGTSLVSPRPPLGDKRDSNMTAPPGDVRDARSARTPIVSERTGKKKKFQGLRRLVGLHD